MTNRYEMGRVPVHFPIRAEEPYVDVANRHGSPGSYAVACLDTQLPVAPCRSEFDRLVAEARKLLGWPAGGA